MRAPGRPGLFILRFSRISASYKSYSMFDSASDSASLTRFLRVSILRPILRSILRSILRPVLHPILHPILRPILHPVLHSVLRPILRPVLHSVVTETGAYQAPAATERDLQHARLAFLTYLATSFLLFSLEF